MKFKTHLAFSFLCFLVFWNYFSSTFSSLDIERWLFAVVLLFGSLLPDIDSSKSFLGHYFEPLPWFFRHRGLFHSLLFGTLCSIPFLFLNMWLGMALFLGYLSHLVLDMLNHKGVMLFLPFSKFKIRGFFKSGGFADKMLFFISLIAILLFTLL